MSHARVEISDAALRVVAAHAAAAGLCPLIPIPFVDDYLINRVKARMNDSILQQHRIALGDDAHDLLIASRSRFFEGVMRAAVVWPVKKLIKKVVLVFMLKTCADIAAAVFHEGWLLARALEQHYVDDIALRRQDPDALRHLRRAILTACDEVDISLTQQLMRSVFNVSSELLSSIMGTFKQLGRRHFRGDPTPATQRAAEPLGRRIETIIQDQWLLGAPLDQALRATCGA